MKTVAELAKESNVSNKTIYRHLDKVKQSDKGDMTVSIGGVTYITAFGEEKIIERLTDVRQNRDMSGTIPVNVKDSVKPDQMEEKQGNNTSAFNPEVELIKMMKEQINNKDEIIKNKEQMLSDKDEYIKELTAKITDMTARLATLFENSQQLHQNQQLLQAKTIQADDNAARNGDEEQQKQGFFKKIFSKK